jgi:hypothetical protein
VGQAGYFVVAPNQRGYAAGAAGIRWHSLAFVRSLEMPDGEQRRPSGHHKTFREPEIGPDILADNANWLRARLTKNGVPPAAIEAHLSVIGNPQAMEAALAVPHWRRAAPGRAIVPGCSDFTATNGVNLYDGRAANLQTVAYFVVFLNYP